MVRLDLEISNWSAVTLKQLFLYFLKQISDKIKFSIFEKINNDKSNVENTKFKVFFFLGLQRY